MGSGVYSSTDWVKYATNVSVSKLGGKSIADAGVHEIFDRHTIAQNLDPAKITVRESRDSADNPLSTPVIVGLDVTGSMGMVLGYMAKVGLNTLMTSVYEHQPITNPHMMAMAIGDIECDKAPLQVTQFEADIRIAEQLEQIYIEQGGGGNDSESYTLPWYFAAHHTATDSFEKRGKKGFLFTVGDEFPPTTLPKGRLSQLLGGKEVKGKTDTESLLDIVSERWNVYHLIVAEGSFARSNKSQVRDTWADIMGDRAIWLKNHRHMAETIVSILQTHLSSTTSVAAPSPTLTPIFRAMDLDL